MSEEEALSKLKDGSQTALKVLFDLYYTDLTRYAIKIIGNTESAEEIVQDIFVSVWKNREKSQIEVARHYLSRAVKNRCINYINSNFPVHEDIEHSMQISSGDSPDTNLESVELQKVLEDAEKRLPKQTALIFGLSRHTELTYPQIASELDISVKTVEYHISKALKSMRAFLNESGLLLLLLIWKIL